METKNVSELLERLAAERGLEETFERQEDGNWVLTWNTVEDDADRLHVIVVSEEEQLIFATAGVYAELDDETVKEVQKFTELWENVSEIQTYDLFLEENGTSEIRAGYFVGFDKIESLMEKDALSYQIFDYTSVKLDRFIPYLFSMMEGTHTAEEAAKELGESFIHNTLQDDMHKIRYQIEHEDLWQMFYDDSEEWVQLLNENGSSVFTKLYAGYFPEGDFFYYSDSDFTIERIEKGNLRIWRVDMPDVMKARDCYAVFFVLRGEQAAYFTLEYGEEADFLCSWSEDGVHFNYNCVPKTLDAVYEKIVSIMEGKSRSIAWFVPEREVSLLDQRIAEIVREYEESAEERGGTIDDRLLWLQEKKAETEKIPADGNGLDGMSEKEMKLTALDKVIHRYEQEILRIERKKEYEALKAEQKKKADRKNRRSRYKRKNKKDS